MSEKEIDKITITYKNGDTVWVNDINLIEEYAKLQRENQQLKADNYRLEHNEKVLLKREESAINYVDQVIGYKPCAREIDEELNTLIGILKGGNNEQ